MQEVDVAIIGAGAAGVAAASRLASAPIRVLVLEARNRIGGRAWTMHIGGFPLDLGCGWLHSADENEWSTIAKDLGFEIEFAVAMPLRRDAFVSILAFEWL
jgi:monoamine oxidase